jgi:hypothetical protein
MARGGCETFRARSPPAHDHKDDSYYGRLVIGLDEFRCIARARFGWTEIRLR